MNAETCPQPSNRLECEYRWERKKRCRAVENKGKIRGEDKNAASRPLVGTRLVNKGGGGEGAPQEFQHPPDDPESHGDGGETGYDNSGTEIINKVNVYPRISFILNWWCV